VEPGPVGGVGAVIVDAGRILLVRRRAGAYAGYWAVPGGKQRFAESMRAAVAREVLEETGLVVDVGDVVWAGDAMDEADPPVWHFAIVDFAATVVGGELEAGDDADAVEWVPLYDLGSYRLTPTMVELIETLR
jgi:acetyl-CoA carboxylase carboxyl transferase subunit beta